MAKALRLEAQIEALRVREAKLWCKVAPRAIAIQILGQVPDFDTQTQISEIAQLRLEIRNLELIKYLGWQP